MSDIRVPKCNCPKCGHNLDAATEMTPHGGGVQPGNLGVCAYCGAMLIYTDNLLPEILTEEQFKPLPIEIKRGLLNLALFAFNGKLFGK
jgi:hypothetical protein